MLILTRKIGESLAIGNEITITIVQARAQVKLGIKAPEDVCIIRTELLHDEQGHDLDTHEQPQR